MNINVQYILNNDLLIKKNRTIEEQKEKYQRRVEFMKNSLKKSKHSFNLKIIQSYMMKKKTL